MSNRRIGMGAVLVVACLGAVVVTPAVARAQAADDSGEAVHAKYCASCHDQADPRTPTREALTRMSPARILRTLDFGLMMSVAYPIRRDEREAVANFLGTGTADVTPSATAFCEAGRPLMEGPLQDSWTGWAPS